jgi:hypothetical protein
MLCKKRPIECEETEQYKVIKVFLIEIEQTINEVILFRFDLTLLTSGAESVFLANIRLKPYDKEPTARSKS